MPPDNVSPRYFNKGDKVEVIQTDDADISVYFPATVLRSSPGSHKDCIYIEFDTFTPSYSSENVGSRPIPLRKYVNVGRVRPVPPPDFHRYLKVGEMINGFHDGAWRKGFVADILENSKYKVLFDGINDENFELDQWNLRVHRDWDYGSWVPPPEIQVKASEPEVKPREVKLRIRCRGRQLEATFSKGALVEVKSEEEGYWGSWYPAVLAESVGNDKFLVEYRTLKANDETETLREVIEASFIRPCPPEIKRLDSFEQHEQVDAWCNDGWWSGVISEVLDSSKYIVSFGKNKELLFEHSKLRPHQEWVDGKWITASKVSSPEMVLNSKQVKLKIKYNGRKSESIFRNGMMVEVKSDEEGFQGSWYTATIVRPLGNGMFLVEYNTLKTDDESELLKEKADASYIRPCPPRIQQGDFYYKVLEEVDAWYNDGWWVGLVSKILDGLKYSVYFWTTNEELVFEHHNLRPHQEWTGGNWVVASRGNSKFLVESKLGHAKKQPNGVIWGFLFRSGTKVEVRSDEGYMGGFWYPAVIIRPTGIKKYMVEYRTLKMEDEGELLKEEVDALCVRPSPPVIQKILRFRPRQEVDAWYNNGWWVGYICRVLEGSKYTINLRAINEVIEFLHCNVRPHQELVDEKWILSPGG